MALNNKRNRWWTRLHLLLRCLGLTGVLVGVAGLICWAAQINLPGEPLLPSWLLGGGTDALLLVCGGGAVLLALLVEAALMLRLGAARRSVAGSNAVFQGVLAVGLLVLVNLYAVGWTFRWPNQIGFDPSHFARLDWTRDQRFTLPADLQDQLRQLHGETTIVLLQKHKALEQLADKPAGEDDGAAYRAAAEDKVVEKVKDLVEQFRAFGPQFQVTVLDDEKQGYKTRLQDLLDRAPELRDPIAETPESSIFFYAKRHDGSASVQRLNFSDFYQLDLTASQEANGGKGNLVLMSQGVEPFARKVLNIDEKRPRVALGVIHGLLSTEGSEELGMAGFKKALTSRGFDVRDVILKKETDTGLDPAVLTFDENKLEQIEAQSADLEAVIKIRDEELETLNKHLKQWKEAKTAEQFQELAKSPLARQLGVQRVTEKVREQVVERVLEPNVELRKLGNEQDRKELEGLKKEREGLKKVEENLAEARRNTDLRSKTSRVLADCDLLVLPRMTLFNAARGERIPPAVYHLDPAQVDAIREFVQSGKPLLVCLGPNNDAPGRFDLGGSGADDLERMLGRFGVKLGQQTVLFNVESKSFAQRRSGLLIAGASNVEVPPLRFDWKPGEGKPRLYASEYGKPNPLLESLRLTARSLGKGRTLELRFRNPRPVYYDPEPGRAAPVVGALAAAPGHGGIADLPWQGLFFLSRFKPGTDYEPEFLMTDAESWNENQPFPSRERTPHYEPPKPDETAGDPFERKRMGPFPVGVAVEVTDWYSVKGNQPVTFRVAAIGHGGVFMAPTLTPAREKLLLDVTNWLLGRDELLTHEQAEWKYPRVALDEQQQRLWHWGTQVGLPLVFAYLGFMVLLVRQMS
jgi:hypothetical protein